MRSEFSIRIPRNFEVMIDLIVKGRASLISKAYDSETVLFTFNIEGTEEEFWDLRAISDGAAAGGSKGTDDEKRVEAAYELKLVTSRLTQPCGRTLDFGCGTGRHSQGLAELCGKGNYDGVDLSDKMLCLARTMYPSLRFHKLNQVIPFDDNTFNTVVSFQTLKHILGDDLLESLVDSLARLTVKGGQHAHLDVTKSTSTLDVSYIKMRPPEQIEECFKRHGIIMQHQDCVNPHGTVTVWWGKKA